MRAAAKTVCGLMAALIAAGILCTPPPSREGPDYIDVEQEKVYVAPVAAEETLSLCPGWPADKGLQRLLLDNVRQIRAGLIDELKRCQKYGFYEVVDSLHAPTVRIELAIVTHMRRGDTLFLPVRARIDLASAARTVTKDLEAYGVVPADSAAALPHHWLGHALADYRRTFPYRQLVAAFYQPRR